MCGLFVVNRRSRHFKLIMDRAAETLSHRGTNGICALDRDDIRFYHNLLPIQSTPESGLQPYIHRDAVGCFVGEVFNFDEGIPADQETTPDSIVALSSVIEYGPHIAREFDGFFSMVYQHKGGLIGQTDHLGIKPLYFDEETESFASEVRTLRQLRSLSVRCRTDYDMTYFSNVRKWGYSPDTRTPIRGIHRIPPGHFLHLDPDGRWSLHPYFPLEPEKTNPDKLRMAMFESVRRRITHSNKKIALLVSGGLDSTIILQIARELVGSDQLNVFHADNGESEFLDYLDLPPEQVHCLPNLNASDQWKEALKANDLPVDLGSAIPQYRLGAELGKAGYRVVLTGDGADELFGGYRRAKEYDSQYSDVFVELPNYHLPRLDAAMMWSTVEVRSPFLAPSVIRQALSLRWEGNRQEKEFLKRAFEDLVPKPILDRKKKPLRPHSEVLTQAHRERLISQYGETVIP